VHSVQQFIIGEQSVNVNRRDHVNHKCSIVSLGVSVLTRTRKGPDFSGPLS
jgi:hypothetical protein